MFNIAKGFIILYRYLHTSVSIPFLAPGTLLSPKNAWGTPRLHTLGGLWGKTHCRLLFYNLVTHLEVTVPRHSV